MVEGAAEGRLDLLKERSLGVSVFDREPDYDTNQDPSSEIPPVRCGRGSRSTITSPDGKANFESTCRPVPMSRKFRRRRLSFPSSWFLSNPEPPARTGALGLGGSLRGCTRLLADPIGSVPDAAVLVANSELSGNVVLSVGQGHTYKLTPELDQFYENGQRMPDGQRLESIPLRDISPAWDRYVALSDARALMHFATLFARFDKDGVLRGGRSTSLTELRGKPLVLVGALNNDWTLRLTGELRFYFELDSERKVEIVRDRQNPIRQRNRPLSSRRYSRRRQLPPPVGFSERNLSYAGLWDLRLPAGSKRTFSLFSQRRCFPKTRGHQVLSLPTSGRRLDQNILDDFAEDVRQSKITAGVAIGERCVVET